MNLSSLTDDELWSELARRAQRPDAGITAEVSARALLVQVCAAVGFPAPRANLTLIEWADAILDSPLGPRGCPAWQEGHERVLDALAAAMQGSAPIARVSLVAALDVVREHANRSCSCGPVPPLVIDPATDRSFCARCRLRRLSV